MHVLGTNLNKILIKIQKFSIKEKTSENIVFDMASILSQPQWINPENFVAAVSDANRHQRAAVKGTGCHHVQGPLFNHVYCLVTRCNTLFQQTTLFHQPNLLVNSLATEKFQWNFRYVIFKWILAIDGWGISCEIALPVIWMSLDFTDDQSTLVQVMAWCRQATSHYLSQCWPRSLSPYGVIRPQWVDSYVM